MQLDSGQFVIFVFAVWLAWRLLPKAAGPGILFMGSILFYALSDLRHLGLLLLMAVINYASVSYLSKSDDPRKRGVVFTAALVVDVGLLAFYKWASAHLDMSASTGIIRDLLPINAVHTVAFPLGLSFFTFQMISCVTDVYRGTYKWTTGIGSFFLFAFFFPQISAGPIPRADALVPQLTRQTRSTPEDIEAGITLFAYGLFKKIVIANRLQDYSNAIFSTDLRTSFVPMWLACAFSALALYADFSGYTDMARGVARLFGIDLAQNFNLPLLAESLTDYWRRWHMTLSFWLRDYLYMPLVIRLRNLGKAAFVFSFLLTFLICGLWHGVGWTFAIWGLMHGTVLCLEFLTRQPRLAWSKKWIWIGHPWIGRAYVFLVFVLTNVMFRAPRVSEALGIYKRLLTPSLPRSVAELCGYLGPMLFGLILAALVLWVLMAALEKKWAKLQSVRFILLCAMISLILGKLSEGGFVYVAF